MENKVSRVISRENGLYTGYNVPCSTKIVPKAKNKLANAHFTRLCELLKIIQTPLRTAFHDTQRLLLETYASNMCSDFVLFAQLMKK